MEPKTPNALVITLNAVERTILAGLIDTLVRQGNPERLAEIDRLRALVELTPEDLAQCGYNRQNQTFDRIKAAALTLEVEIEPWTWHLLSLALGLRAHVGTLPAEWRTLYMKLTAIS